MGGRGASATGGSGGGAARAAAAGSTPAASTSASAGSGGSGNFAKDFDAAFSAAPGARDNYVTLDALRSALPQYDRATFDAGLRQLRVGKQVSLDAHDGRQNRPSAKELSAAVNEGGKALTLVARRS